VIVLVTEIFVIIAYWQLL